MIIIIINLFFFFTTEMVPRHWFKVYNVMFWYTLQNAHYDQYN